MPRYIDADALISKIAFHRDSLKPYNVVAVSAFDAVIGFIKRRPTISPDEVRGVGKWVRISGFHLDHEYYPARYKCDQCGHFVDIGDDRNYCPNCGRKMEGGEQCVKT